MKRSGASSPGSLTINGSRIIVGGMLTLTPEGTLTVNSGGSLSYTSFVQQGGIVSGTIIDAGSYTYQGGLFNGRLVNQGTASLGNNFTAGNGIENDTSMSLASGQKLTVNGAGFDNLGSLTMSGGNIGGSGSVHERLRRLGCRLVAALLTKASPTTEHLPFPESHRSAAAQTMVKLPSVSHRIFSSLGSPPRSLTKPAALSSAMAGPSRGSFSMPLGEMSKYLPHSLGFVNGWNNEGFVSMGGANALLNGGPINNTATIQGAGQISPAVTNSGLINATAGQLNLAGTGNTNAASGVIKAGSGATVDYIQGLGTNAGSIELSGTFEQRQPLANAG